MPDEKAPSTRYVELPLADARRIYTREKLQEIADRASWGRFAKAWSYRTAGGGVIAIDARFESGDKHTCRTFWYTGEYLKCTSPPVVLYNLDLIRRAPDAAILIVQSSRSADIAMEIDPGIIPTTWSGAPQSYHFADWSELEGRIVYIYPDDDRLKTPDGRPIPWTK